ncbi:CsgG/HfaB family protein, partial [bacterium]|nr:CsgG/HfaB family protein [bacterium]
MKKILLFVIAISIISLAEESVTIAVLKLRPSGLQESEAEILTDYVRSILVEMNLYQVVDRGKMKEILNEQEFQLSGCTSTECAVEVGKLLGVQKMLTGSVGKFGKLFTIELRMINIETSRIEKSSRYNYEGPIEQLLTEGIQNAIKKLVQVHKLEDEDEVIQEEVIEEEVIKEEIIEEEVIEEEIVPEEEELIEEEIILEEEEEVVEEIVEEPTEFKPGWTAKVYINGGPIEPWGSPGTGTMFNVGMRAQIGAQLNIGNWVSLPTVLHPLTAEIMAGYGMWNIKEESNNGNNQDASTNVISVLALGRYDVTDLIL